MVLILDIGFSGIFLRLETTKWATQILHSKEMRDIFLSFEKVIAPQSFSGGGLVFKGKLVTMDKYMNGYCGIWVIRACAVSHTEFVTFFDSCWLL